MKGSRISPAIVICDTREQASLRVAEMIAEAIRDNPSLVLGLATGGTPVGVYQHLVRMHQEESLDFSGVTTFNLDEYIGLGPEHPQSYRSFMRQHLFDHVNLHASRTHLPDGLAGDPDGLAGDPDGLAGDMEAPRGVTKLGSGSWVGSTCSC